MEVINLVIDGIIDLDVVESWINYAHRRPHHDTPLVISLNNINTYGGTVNSAPRHMATPTSPNRPMLSSESVSIDISFTKFKSSITSFLQNELKLAIRTQFLNYFALPCCDLLRQLTHHKPIKKTKVTKIVNPTPLPDMEIPINTFGSSLPTDTAQTSFGIPPGQADIFSNSFGPLSSTLTDNSSNEKCSREWSDIASQGVSSLPHNNIPPITTSTAVSSRKPPSPKSSSIAPFRAPKIATSSLIPPTNRPSCNRPLNDTSLFPQTSISSIGPSPRGPPALSSLPTTTHWEIPPPVMSELSFLIQPHPHSDTDASLTHISRLFSLCVVYNIIPIQTLVEFLYTISNVDILVCSFYCRLVQSIKHDSSLNSSQSQHSLSLTLSRLEHAITKHNSLSSLGVSIPHDKSYSRYIFTALRTPRSIPTCSPPLNSYLILNRTLGLLSTLAVRKLHPTLLSSLIKASIFYLEQSTTSSKYSVTLSSRPFLTCSNLEWLTVWSSMSSIYSSAVIDMYSPLPPTASFPDDVDNNVDNDDDDDGHDHDHDDDDDDHDDDNDNVYHQAIYSGTTVRGNMNHGYDDDTNTNTHNNGPSNLKFGNRSHNSRQKALVKRAKHTSNEKLSSSRVSLPFSFESFIQNPSFAFLSQIFVVTTHSAPIIPQLYNNAGYRSQLGEMISHHIKQLSSRSNSVLSNHYYPPKINRQFKSVLRTPTKQRRMSKRASLATPSNKHNRGKPKHHVSKIRFVAQKASLPFPSPLPGTNPPGDESPPTFILPDADTFIRHHSSIFALGGDISQNYNPNNTIDGGHHASESAPSLTDSFCLSDDNLHSDPEDILTQSSVSSSCKGIHSRHSYNDICWDLAKTTSFPLQSSSPPWAIELMDALCDGHSSLIFPPPRTSVSPLLVTFKYSRPDFASIDPPPPCESLFKTGDDKLQIPIADISIVAPDQSIPSLSYLSHLPLSNSFVPQHLLPPSLFGIDHLDNLHPNNIVDDFIGITLFNHHDFSSRDSFHVGNGDSRDGDDLAPSASTRILPSTHGLQTGTASVTSNRKDLKEWLYLLILSYQNLLKSGTYFDDVAWVPDHPFSYHTSQQNSPLLSQFTCCTRCTSHLTNISIPYYTHLSSLISGLFLPSNPSRMPRLPDTSVTSFAYFPSIKILDENYEWFVITLLNELLFKFGTSPKRLQMEHDVMKSESTGLCHRCDITARVGQSYFFESRIDVSITLDNMFADSPVLLSPAHCLCHRILKRFSGIQSLFLLIFVQNNNYKFMSILLRHLANKIQSLINFDIGIGSTVSLSDTRHHDLAYTHPRFGSFFPFLHSLTARLQKLCLLGRFLGALTFWPQHKHIVPGNAVLTPSVRLSLSVAVVINHFVSSTSINPCGFLSSHEIPEYKSYPFHLTHSPQPLDILSILQKSIQCNSVATAVPWICELLSFVTLDDDASQSAYYAHIFAFMKLHYIYCEPDIPYPSNQDNEQLPRLYQRYKEKVGDLVPPVEYNHISPISSPNKLFSPSTPPSTPPRQRSVLNPGPSQRVSHLQPSAVLTNGSRSPKFNPRLHHQTPSSALVLSPSSPQCFTPVSPHALASDKQFPQTSSAAQNLESGAKSFHFPHLEPQDDKMKIPVFVSISTIVSCAQSVICELISSPLSLPPTTPLSSSQSQYDHNYTSSNGNVISSIIPAIASAVPYTLSPSPYCYSSLSPPTYDNAHLFDKSSSPRPLMDGEIEASEANFRRLPLYMQSALISSFLSPLSNVNHSIGHVIVDSLCNFTDLTNLDKHSRPYGYCTEMQLSTFDPVSPHSTPHRPTSLSLNQQSQPLRDPKCYSIALDCSLVPSSSSTVGPDITLLFTVSSVHEPRIATDSPLHCPKGFCPLDYLIWTLRLLRQPVDTPDSTIPSLFCYPVDILPFNIVSLPQTKSFSPPSFSAGCLSSLVPPIDSSETDSDCIIDIKHIISSTNAFLDELNANLREQQITQSRIEPHNAVTQTLASETSSSTLTKRRVAPSTAHGFDTVVNTSFLVEPVGKGLSYGTKTLFPGHNDTSSSLPIFESATGSASLAQLSESTPVADFLHVSHADFQVLTCPDGLPHLIQFIRAPYPLCSFPLPHINLENVIKTVLSLDPPSVLSMALHDPLSIRFASILSIPLTHLIAHTSLYAILASCLIITTRRMQTTDIYHDALSNIFTLPSACLYPLYHYTYTPIKVQGDPVVPKTPKCPWLHSHSFQPSTASIDASSLLSPMDVFSETDITSLLRVHRYLQASFPERGSSVGSFIDSLKIAISSPEITPSKLLPHISLLLTLSNALKSINTPAVQYPLDLSGCIDLSVVDPTATIAHYTFKPQRSNTGMCIFSHRTVLFLSIIVPSYTIIDFVSASSISSETTVSVDDISIRYMQDMSPCFDTYQQSSSYTIKSVLAYTTHLSPPLLSKLLPSRPLWHPGILPYFMSSSTLKQQWYDSISKLYPYIPSTVSIIHETLNLPNLIRNNMLSELHCGDIIINRSISSILSLLQCITDILVYSSPQIVQYPRKTIHHSDLPRDTTRHISSTLDTIILSGLHRNNQSAPVAAFFSPDMPFYLSRSHTTTLITPLLTLRTTFISTIINAAISQCIDLYVLYYQVISFNMYSSYVKSTFLHVFSAEFNSSQAVAGHLTAHITAVLYTRNLTSTLPHIIQSVSQSTRSAILSAVTPYNQSLSLLASTLTASNTKHVAGIINSLDHIAQRSHTIHPKPPNNPQHIIDSIVVLFHSSLPIPSRPSIVYACSLVMALVWCLQYALVLVHFHHAQHLSISVVSPSQCKSSSQTLYDIRSHLLPRTTSLTTLTSRSPPPSLDNSFAFLPSSPSTDNSNLTSFPSLVRLILSFYGYDYGLPINTSYIVNHIAECVSLILDRDEHIHTQPSLGDVPLDLIVSILHAYNTIPQSYPDIYDYLTSAMTTIPAMSNVASLIYDLLISLPSHEQIVLYLCTTVPPDETCAFIPWQAALVHLYHRLRESFIPSHQDPKLPNLISVSSRWVLSVPPPCHPLTIPSFQPYISFLLTTVQQAIEFTHAWIRNTSFSPIAPLSLTLSPSSLIVTSYTHIVLSLPPLYQRSDLSHYSLNEQISAFSELIMYYYVPARDDLMDYLPCPASQSRTLTITENLFTFFASSSLQSSFSLYIAITCISILLFTRVRSLFLHSGSVPPSSMLRYANTISFDLQSFSLPSSEIFAPISSLFAFLVKLLQQTS